jgi:hypothetical protein
MLSNQIGEEAGQVTGTRVLPDEGAGPEIEMSIQENGTLLGVPVNEMCTFVSVVRPDGTLFAQGQGVATTDDGEMAPWQGEGAAASPATARRRPGAGPSTSRPPRRSWRSLTASPWYLNSK